MGLELTTLRLRVTGSIDQASQVPLNMCNGALISVCDWASSF